MCIPYMVEVFYTGSKPAVVLDLDTLNYSPAVSLRPTVVSLELLPAASLKHPTLGTLVLVCGPELLQSILAAA